MQYSLGIDAGGTYTDAVLIRNRDGKVVDSAKSLTTYPNLIIGIHNVLGLLNREYMENINLVSVSTTLSTNTLLEKTGASASLILIGDHPLERELAAENYIFIAGGHDQNGEESTPLDLNKVEEYIKEVQDNVSVFAVSAYFGTRNPEHELKVKDKILELTGKPVVCGHELSQELGAYERAVTALLNAQLIPVTTKFIRSVIHEIEKLGIQEKMLMLRCDGSVVNIEDALHRPIETIFSGPAASLVGASYLADLNTCAVMDVGGTSTDVSAIYKGLPELKAEGATVGGWKTRVKAIDMETSAMGGDSHIWVTKKRVNIGPRRVIPLCVAATHHPQLMEILNEQAPTFRVMENENFQPTRFFMKSQPDNQYIDPQEKEILDLLDEQPVPIQTISHQLNGMPSANVLDSLIQKRLVQVIGFTPTDALHVLGDYTEWNVEASEKGAEMLSKLLRKNKVEFCENIKEMFAKNMSRELIRFLLPDVEEKVIMDILNGKYPARLNLDIPVVLVGGPVKAYVDEIQKILIADIKVPESFEVGNAVGALMGKGIKRVDIMIRPHSLQRPEEDFLVFAPGQRKQFKKYVDALDFARKTGEDIVKGYMNKCRIDSDRVKITFEKKTVIPDGWHHPPMETRLIVMGVGTPNIG
ncbi:hydantoinase/oxoprolinase family protein [Methanohalophilus mahii]|uniref:Hydantoinase/oxoprolinase n=1 Tax=Methanohalophilus mahii (strain ATCC 35705 / DSM 5219 / SLP) TaxID=547558 RepID=D5EAR8_METMS|nr:hydantoinase/oxoprolinase family protein [Methanohalophilus mahii]ADE36269.1 Hydantoinase/oxoprolinase [Methanohalophilus mahii DSM 5219]